MEYDEIFDFAQQAEMLPLNSEYDNVSEIVQKSLKSDQFCISAIFKVKNPELERLFELQKTEITEKIGEEPEVQDVFHGTTKTAAKNIMIEGFNPSYNKTSAYGLGTYSSPSIKLALGYCKDAFVKGNMSMVFLCKMLKGKYIRTPSNKAIDTNKGDYSGDGKNIFVTPYRYGIIPIYLICYYTWDK